MHYKKKQKNKQTRKRGSVWMCVPYFSVLLIVAYEVTELLLSALQRGIKLLHLIHQVCLLCFQTLTVRLHGWKTEFVEGQIAWRFTYFYLVIIYSVDDCTSVTNNRVQRIITILSTVSYKWLYVYVRGASPCYQRACSENWRWSRADNMIK